MASSEALCSTDVIQILEVLDKGTAMQRFRAGRKDPLRKIFCLKLETFEILQLPTTSTRGKSPQPEEYGEVTKLKL